MRYDFSFGKAVFFVSHFLIRGMEWHWRKTCKCYQMNSILERGQKAQFFFFLAQQLKKLSVSDILTEKTITQILFLSRYCRKGRTVFPQIEVWKRQAGRLSRVGAIISGTQENSGPCISFLKSFHNLFIRLRRSKQRHQILQIAEQCFLCVNRNTTS